MRKIAMIIVISVVMLLNLSMAIRIRVAIDINNSFTDMQLMFVNSHYDYVMTPDLSDRIRNFIQNPNLLLYRSIQGTWPSVDHWNWLEDINPYENMFCHWDSSETSDTRIYTKWWSLLMDGNDLVSPDTVDALHHWVNFYATTASSQVYSKNYDGLFIDSAGHILKSSELQDTTQMPWDYNDDTWREGRYAALSFIKSHLPDKIVIFNGLHNRHGADSSLTLTDGGMWEDFAYNLDDGAYKGRLAWWLGMKCMHDNRDIAQLSLVVKKPGLINDLTARIFSIASYLLVYNENVVFTLSDFTWRDSLQYYPEYEIDLGDPISDLQILGDSTFAVREFEKGIVLVNPTTNTTITYNLQDEYYEIIPVGGGIINDNAEYNGYLDYSDDAITGEIEIPPVSAIILKKSDYVNIANAGMPRIDMNNYPNPFNPETIISFNLPSSKLQLVSLFIFNIKGELVRKLINNRLLSGHQSIIWNGKNEYGKKISSGIYIYELYVNNKSLNKKKCLLIK